MANRNLLPEFMEYASSAAAASNVEAMAPFVNAAQLHLENEIQEVFSSNDQVRRIGYVSRNPVQRNVICPENMKVVAVVWVYTAPKEVSFSNRKLLSNGTYVRQGQFERMEMELLLPDDFEKLYDVRVFCDHAVKWAAGILSMQKKTQPWTMMPNFYARYDTTMDHMAFFLHPRTVLKDDEYGFQRPWNYATDCPDFDCEDQSIPNPCLHPSNLILQCLKECQEDFSKRSEWKQFMRIREPVAFNNFVLEFRFHIFFGLPAYAGDWSFVYGDLVWDPIARCKAAIDVFRETGHECFRPNFPLMDMRFVTFHNAVSVSCSKVVLSVGFECASEIEEEDDETE